MEPSRDAVHHDQDQPDTSPGAHALMRRRMSMLASIATCVALAASHYAVAPSRIDAVIRAAQASPSPSRFGVMGIPQPWVPYLKVYGFDPNKLRSDPCENIVAGVWILAATDRIKRLEAQWATDDNKLPARARPWQFTVRWVANKARISPSLLNAVIQQESRFHADAIGPMTRSGERAIGLMQIMPSTAAALGIDPSDPAQNLWGGAWYLSNLVRGYSGNIALALAAYNAGPAAVARYGGIPPYQQTEHYVPAVIRRAQRYADSKN